MPDDAVRHRSGFLNIVHFRTFEILKFIIYYNLDLCQKHEEKAGMIFMVLETFRPEETYEFAKKIGGCAKPGQIYTLDGDLGVGKTVFAKGLADGLGVTEPVSSPTFTIVQEYQGRQFPFYHFDVYRIEEPEEMEEIGYEDYFYGGGVCLIEWADMIREILPEDVIRVTIAKDPEKGFDYRRIEITGISGPQI